MIWNYCYLNPGLTIIYNGEKFYSDNGLFDLLEQNSAGGTDIAAGGMGEDSPSFEPWGGETNSSYLVIILVVLVVCLLVFMIFFRGKKKVVYLKPKKSSDAETYAVVAKVSKLKGLKIRVMGNSLIISKEIKIIINKREFLKKGTCIFINVFLFE